MSNMTPQAVSNFLVPATGSTNALLRRENFSATPVLVNFNVIMLDGVPFRPSGVIIDNTTGTDPIQVLINEISLAITCPAGVSMQMPYPAPTNHTANITGNGIASVIFVDYPLIPFTNGGASSAVPVPLPVEFTGPQPVALTNPIPLPVEMTGAPQTIQGIINTVNVSGPLTDAELRANPVPVTIGGGSPTVTAVLETHTGTGATPDCFMASFKNTGANPATVAFGSLPAGETITFEAPVGKMISAISYDATSTTLLVAFEV